MRYPVINEYIATFHPYITNATSSRSCLDPATEIAPGLANDIKILTDWDYTFDATMLARLCQRDPEI